MKRPMDTPADRLPINAINVGKRHRQHMGDIEGLAASIAENGLLHPVVITPERTLIAGERRLLAARLLGWTDVPVTIVPIKDIVRGEVAENVVRADFTPTEMAAIAAALRPVEEAAARERETLGKVSTGSSGRTRDRVAGYLGVSGRTLEKIEQVMAAAESDPEFGTVVAKMDETGKVEPALREIKRTLNRKAVAALPPVTGHVEGQKYRAIVIDPPWDKRDEGDVDQMGRAQPTYHTMTISEIADLPVGDDADDGCHIYLWITNRSLPKGFALLEAWDFRYVTALTWCKPTLGVGNYFRNNTEHVLFGIRGSLQLTHQDIGTWFEAARGPDGHSSKPEEFYAMVRRASPGPRAEWFGRRDRDGFVQRLPAVEPAA